MTLRREIRKIVSEGTLEQLKEGATPSDAVAVDGDNGTCDLQGSYLHICAENNRLDMAEYLIQLGAKVNHRGGLWSTTPLTYAAERGHLEMVQLLRNYGGEFDLDDPRTNPLFMAIEAGHINVVKYLLEAGLDPHLVYRVDRGKLQNALTFAKGCGSTEVVKLLVSLGCRIPVEGIDQPVWELPQDQWTQVDESAENIVEYMSARFGAVDHLAMQELLPVVDGMSVAINVIRPNDEHPYLVLFTNGMSDRPLTVPSGQEAWRYAELVIHLPADWVHPQDANGDLQWLWPVQWLRKMAYHPHLNDTWLGLPAAIVSSADPPEPLGPNTKQTCLLLVPDFANLGVPLQRSDGGQVHFFTVVPLFASERDYEVKHGMKAFFERFIAKQVPMIVDVQRPPFIY